jgi:pimeloyl-ACP methyl ester carboxylesterase
VKRAYVDTKHGQIHYRCAGQGETVVLLHMSGSSSDEFEEAGDILAERFSVVALDLPGFGGSDPPPRFYSLKDHAQVVADCLTALNRSRAILAGNLVGANIAARVAVSWPERVSGLLLCHAVYDTDYGQFRARRASPSFCQVEIKADGSHLLEYWRRASQYGETIEYANARAVCLHLAGALGESLHWALFEDDDYGEIFPEIKAPAVVAALGKVGSAPVQPFVASLIPGAKYTLIEGATPYLPRVSPQVFARLLLENF